MSLFRKQPSATNPTPASNPVASEPVRMAPAPQAEPLLNGANVDMPSIYRTAKLTADELDRVARAEDLLHLLPGKAAHTRDIVDATFRAFGVDRTSIVDAATKQLDALERFIRFSHEQTQGVLDVGAKRIAELEAEINRCRKASDEATREGEERARTVNNEMVKVQHVLEFFGGAAKTDVSDDDDELDKSTVVKPGAGVSQKVAKP